MAETKDAKEKTTPTRTSKNIPTTLQTDVNTITQCRNRLRELEAHFGMRSGQLCWTISEGSRYNLTTEPGTPMTGSNGNLIAGGMLGVIWDAHTNTVVATAISYEPTQIFNTLLANLYDCLPHFVTQAISLARAA